MTSKQVVVEGGGENLYKIVEYNGTFTAYKIHVRLLFNNETRIGSAKNMNDAISLIRSHSGRAIKSIS